MIKGKCPSIIFEKNTLVVSSLGSSKFKISEGMVLIGGTPLFIEEQELETDNLNFPFRIGIEIQGLKESDKVVDAAGLAKAGQNIPLNVTRYSLPSLPDDVSKLEPVLVAYNFDNRSFKNSFKSLATVEEKEESIIINQHTHGPLFFKVQQTSSYKEDFVGVVDAGDSASLPEGTVSNAPFVVVLSFLPKKNILI
jgi:hypothetical protein